VPEQRIAVEEALRAYTHGSAFAAFDEQVVGSLAVGRFADLIVLDRDVLALDDPEDLRGTKVDLTMVGGRIVFRR
jgi:predicted amidohydrolase YtcJ